MKSIKSTYLLCAAIPAIALCGATPSYAQNASAQNASSEGGLGEIVVTAQKRSENLQNVPIAITALQGDAAQKLGLTNTSDLAFSTPGLVMHRGTNVLLPSLRGITQTNAAAGDESPIAIYVDNVYYASMSAGMLSFNNIERIEVLKGPQGTLFGRNAVGGVIQIITRKPSEDPSVEAHAGYGNYQTYQADFYGTTGLAKGVATDLAVYFRRQEDGFGTNLTTGNDTFRSRDFAIRNKWLLTPGDRTDITIAADYSNSAGTTGLAKDALPGTTKRFPPLNAHVGGFYDLQDGFDAVSVLKQWGVSADIQQDFDFARFVSISSYRETQPHFHYDLDSSAPNFTSLFANYGTRQITQEFQLVSPLGSPISWIVGAFYLNNRADSDILTNGTNVPTGLRRALATITARSLAGFGEVTVPLGESTHVTGGLRYTFDRQHIVGSTANATTLTPADQTANFKRLTWRLSIDHRFTQDLMVYASYNRGFKAGVYNANAPGDPAINPSVLDAYQVGFKSEWLDGHMRLNGSAYWYDYKGIQLQRVVGPVTQLLNAAAGRIKGADLDLEIIPVEHLRVSGSVAYTDAKYTDFPNAEMAVLRVNPLTRLPTGGFDRAPTDATGNRMIYTPKWSWSTNALYDIPTEVGTFDLAGNLYYNGGYFPDSGNQFFQKSYYLVNASLGWTSSDKMWNLKFWAKNLTDTHYFTHVTFSSSFVSASPMPPRTYGVTLGIKWGNQ